MSRCCESTKVLHLIDSGGMYGAERVVLTLLDELKGSAFQGILGCIRESDSETPGIAIEAQRREVGVVLFTMKRGLSLSGIMKIMRFVKSNNIRIVHCHGYKPNILFSSIPHRGVKILSTVHGWAKRTNGLKGRTYEFLDSIALRRMDRIVAVSNAVFNDIARRDIRKEKIALIYNGIDLGGYDMHPSCGNIRTEYGIPARAFIIGAVGRLAAVKGYQYLIDAMVSVVREIPDCRLLIAGDGPLKESLSEFIADRNLSPYVSLIGYHNSISRFLAMINLFVMTSLTEGLPIALLEAMACRKPILATAVGGIPEAIDNGRGGVLVPPGDSGAIAAGIAKLYREKVRGIEMGERGRAIIEEKFSAKRMADQYVSIYDGLVRWPSTPLATA